MNREPFSLGDRTILFSKRILKFCKSESPTLITRPLLNQLIRSATAIGANYAEANNAASKADFKNKIYIAKKEAAETMYWLTLLSEHTSNLEECKYLVQECHFLLMTFQKIISTLNNGKQKTVNVR
jgi:four helix bundle protein